MSPKIPVSRLRTEAEQSILKTVQALEKELNESETGDRKTELGEQISLLKSQLSRLQGPDYEELQKQNNELKGKLKELEDKVRSFDGKCVKDLSPKDARDRAADDITNLLSLYRVLLKKYSKLINDKERRTVGEVKTLVDKEELTIDSFVSEQKPEGYLFDKDYLEAAEKVFSFIQSEMDCVKADIELNFWLSPGEIMRYRVGDDEDLAVFLCSCLYALGDEKAEVVIAELSDLSTHAVVISYYGKDFLLLDPAQGIPFQDSVGEKKALIENYRYGGKKIKRFLYKFNRLNYEQFI